MYLLRSKIRDSHITVVLEVLCLLTVLIITVLAVVLYYSLVRCYYLGKLFKGYRDGYLRVIS